LEREKNAFKKGPDPIWINIKGNLGSRDVPKGKVKGGKNRQQQNTGEVKEEIRHKWGAKFNWGGGTQPYRGNLGSCIKYDPGNLIHRSSDLIRSP